jgi:hypothetical protein
MLLSDVFTEEAKVRPLFEEPSDASVRQDPWSGPRGFMLGGMSLPTKSELGEQYFDAAYLLLESIKSNQWEDYKLVNPALYLFRHALELQIKALLGASAKTHDLAALADQLDSKALAQDGQRAPPWIIARLKEFAAVDPGSTAFRYAQTYSRELRRDVEVDGEVYVSLLHLQRAMLALYAALTGRLPPVAAAHPLPLADAPIDHDDEA